MQGGQLCARAGVLGGCLLLAGDPRLKSALVLRV
jgi:hypothetical protein